MTVLPNVALVDETVPFDGAIVVHVTGVQVGAVPENVMSAWQARVGDPPFPVSV